VKEGPFKIEKKAGGSVINAPGMIITGDKAGRVQLGIEAIAAQLNRAHEAGRLDGRKALDDEETKLSATYRVQREGWRQIAEALITVGLGYEMRGFGDNPPTEVLEAFGIAIAGVTPTAEETAKFGSAAATSDEAIGAIRDALFGRAWRVRGSQGKGQCDYPLCPNRDDRIAKKQPFALVDVQLATPDGDGATLHVCAANGHEVSMGRNITAHECSRWAAWVQQRAATGRIAVAK
jgi:hypothetical protein